MESLLPVVESYLRECLAVHEVPQVVELSRRLGVSSWSFTRRFARLHGAPPGAFFRRAQLARAMELLHSTRLSLKVIASSCGFSFTRSLYRAFRRETGMTPSEYRHEMSPADEHPTT